VKEKTSEIPAHIPSEISEGSGKEISYINKTITIMKTLKFYTKRLSLKGIPIMLCLLTGFSNTIFAQTYQ